MSRLLKAASLAVFCALILAAPSVWAYWVQDGVALCTATGDQYSPTIISDGAGGAIVTWKDCRSGDYDIYAQRVNASGDVQWTADGVALCTATGIQQYPQITSDGAGGAIVTWQDHRNGYSADIYAQRVNALGAVQWTANGLALCTAAGGQNYPATASDYAGGAIVTWIDYRYGSNPDICGQRVSASGAFRWGPGAAFCLEPEDQISPTITSDLAGGAIVTWMDYRSGRCAGIYAQRVNDWGAAQWTTDGVALCTAETGDQYFPTITSDYGSGAIVTWYGLQGGDYPCIYAQRVNDSGAVQWTTDGVALCTATGDESYPNIVSDDVGGAIVTWMDNHSGPGDIYAQRVNDSGAVLWTANGVALCTAAEQQSYPTIVSDGASGAVVTWSDNRSGNNDIFAQRVNDSGAVQWTVNGVPLCTAAGSQAYPTIVSDGAGGAIITWQDYRSGTNWDIYIQHISETGTGTPKPPEASYLAQNYPNPFNPTTRIAFGLAASAHVSLRIYDAAGRLVRSLANEERRAGTYEESWDGRDSNGRTVASGVYFYRLAAGSFVETKKMALMR